jgi:CRP/FNR family cyclic AMP-dependent transcriptional regulator
MAILRKRSDKADALANVPMFKGLSNKDRLEVARHAEEVEVEAYTFLTQEGQRGNAFYLILTGDADVTKNEKKVASLGSGDFVGEMSLIDGGPRSATVMMTTEGSVLEISRHDFLSLLDSTPGLAKKILVGMSQRLREADEKLVG